MTSARIRDFIVFVDTSAIWTDEKEPSLFPHEFREQWEALAAGDDVVLKIPDVVLQELAYQKHRHALHAYRSARSALAKIESDLGLGTPAIPTATSDYFRKAVTLKLREQIARPSLVCEFVAVPYGALAKRLDDIVDAALWRAPPFKEGKSEAGFRDALILETVWHTHSEALHSDVALISKDERLREAARSRFATATNFGLFLDLQEYRQFLEVARSRFPAEFVHAAIKKADAHFRDRVWKQLGLAANLSQKYGLEIGKWAVAPAAETNEPNTMLTGLFGLGASLQPILDCVGEPSYLYVRTGLLKVVGANEFHWASRVLVLTEYAEKVGGTLATNVEHKETVWRVMFFAIEWAASITDLQEFQNLRLIQDRLQFDKYSAADVSEFKGMGTPLA